MNKTAKNLCRNILRRRHDLPETDVVLESKLDPVNNLRDLGNHSENCHSNKVLEKERNVSTSQSRRPHTNWHICKSWPGRCWVGLVWAGCALWQDQRRRTWARWPWWGWAETSTATSGPLPHGGRSLCRHTDRDNGVVSKWTLALHCIVKCN